MKFANVHLTVHLNFEKDDNESEFLQDSRHEVCTRAPISHIHVVHFMKTPV